MSIRSARDEDAIKPGPGTAEKANLQGAPETSLITLYARALQSHWKRPILNDPWAPEAVARIDYDFARLKVGAPMASLVASRARQLDAWTTDFLAAYPQSTVLHLGCGLDSRVFRANPAPGVRWYDVDMPEVIALRQRLYPLRENCQLVTSSLVDLDWLAHVPADRPILAIAEGLLMYLTEDLIRGLIKRIIDHVPHGRLAFDAHPQQMVQKLSRRKWSVRGTGATFKWGLGTAESARQLDPRLELLAEVRAPQLDGLRSAPWKARLVVRLMNIIPELRIMRCLLYRFGGDSAAHMA